MYKNAKFLSIASHVRSKNQSVSHARRGSYFIITEISKMATNNRWTQYLPRFESATTIYTSSTHLHVALYD